MRSTAFKLILASAAFVLVAGCSSTKTDGSGNSDAKGGATATPTNTTAVQGGNVVKGKNGEPTVMSSGNIVYFDFDQDTIRPDAKEVLMTHAARLKGTSTKATLEGHADERGTREYNMALGERRAKAVRDFLVIQGVAKSQLDVVSYGEERPADPASNEAAWAKNRRVEIK